MVTITTVHRNHPPTARVLSLKRKVPIGSDTNTSTFPIWTLEGSENSSAGWFFKGWILTPTHSVHRSTHLLVHLCSSDGFNWSIDHLHSQILQGSYVPVFPISSHEKVPGCAWWNTVLFPKEALCQSFPSLAPRSSWSERHWHPPTNAPLHPWMRPNQWQTYMWYGWMNPWHFYTLNTHWAECEG